MAALFLAILFVYVFFRDRFLSEKRQSESLIRRLKARRGPGYQGHT
jgi:hypothetical protein